MRTILSVCAFLGLFVCAATAVLAAEGRTPVYAPGTVIAASGKYILTRNLNGTGAPVIQIFAQSVDLDLNGFYVDGAGGVGIQVLGANDVRIHDGVLQNVTIGIDFAPGAVSRTVLEDLRIFAPLSDGIRLDALNRFAIRRVLINQVGPGADGIRIYNGSPATGRIESCQISEGGGRGIYVYGGSSLAIVDNVVNNMSGEGIQLDGCDGCLIKENTVTQAGGQGGIYLPFARGSMLTRNVVSVNKLHGIHIGSGARDILVEGNVMQQNGSESTPGDGLLVAGVGGTIVGNMMTGNTGIGLHFTSTSAYWTFGRNNSRNNLGFAGNPCTGVPTLFYPDSCNETLNNPTTFGDNLIPGPPLF
jgi:parallel beta-helix repeat protein